MRDQLGFSLADIQAARQTRAVADMARSLELPDEVRAKLENPRAKLFTTLERVFDSSVGREYLMIEPDAENGIRGTTSKAEFLRGFRKLVTDVALGKQSSRTLNTNKDIEDYFKSWPKDQRPAKRSGSFVPADIVEGRSVASVGGRPSKPDAPARSRQPTKMVLPRDFKVRVGSDRLRDIHLELIKLNRETFPNAGAVLLRVFFELAVSDYLERIGELPKIIEKIERKEERKLPFGVPTLKQLVPEITQIAKSKLTAPDAARVEKAVRYDPAAPFSISELHGFVHQSDMPSPRDILQFWKRTEPLFRLMLEGNADDVAK